MRRNVLILGFVLLGFFLVACSNFAAELEQELESGSQVIDNDAVSAFENEIQETVDGVKYIIHPDEIMSGGPPKGGIGVDRGIPALAAENINFVSVSEADEWIADNELVLALRYNGLERVYPLQILVWHEIVNDIIAGDAILVTYCPLCGTGIAYEGYISVDGERVESRFGTSGKLYNSNLVMYDEETDTYWQQIDGKAISGELTGQELVEISIDTVVWRDWKKDHPNAEVLSQDTGMRRDYGRDPYGSYYEDSFLFFPVDNEDGSVHPKTVVFGIEVDGVYKAYREDDLVELGSFTDVVAGRQVLVSRGRDGAVTFVDVESGERYVKERGFWFSWYAFHPDTGLYEGE